MKTIALIGGMSWESSLEYYRMINQFVKAELGEPHSAEIIMYSVDFAEFEKLQHQGEWELLSEKMIEIALKLEKAGGDILLICTNTMHKMAAEVEAAINIPLLHIADSAGEKIKEMNLDKVALLGTKFTMEEDFYKKRLKAKYQLDVLIPEAEEREIIHQVIYKELISGIIRAESREKFKKIIEALRSQGAEGVVLGCTEIPLLIKDEDLSIPVFSTSELHAQKAVEFALKS
ncbi:aspartate/glutamate racemase family protein [Halanaerobium sp. Z-7514]|uniref:Aspartate/glutamate racemase family protein n=1 Tax=Halanaerobium polyolivorans TaxID=2886943 RepID=A0AAW4WZF1_9FIRM|nr:aspartate/glutamate racemase family protein [Halanaerobium polyolivorans]MCC3144919.1 aspartate/glutamate racemase family protein [Halanaerobium polyolivorans]